MYLYPSAELGIVKMYTPRATNRKNSTGIMTLLAFSMPPAIPKDMITRLTTTATTIQTFAPHAEAVEPKVPTMVSMS